MPISVRVIGVSMVVVDNSVQVICCSADTINHSSHQGMGGQFLYYWDNLKRVKPLYRTLVATTWLFINTSLPKTAQDNNCQTSNIRHLSKQYNGWSLRCSWSIACRRCSNYIFILDLTHWLHWIWQRQLQGDTRSIVVLRFDATYIEGLKVVFFQQTKYKPT